MFSSVPVHIPISVCGVHTGPLPITLTADTLAARGELKSFNDWTE